MSSRASAGGEWGEAGDVRNMGDDADCGGDERESSDRGAGEPIDGVDEESSDSDDEEPIDVVAVEPVDRVAGGDSVNGEPIDCVAGERGESGSSGGTSLSPNASSSSS